MTKSILNVYVDESGNFGDVNDLARYCVITLVLHDAALDFSTFFKAYYDGIFHAGADPESMAFHTAPLIRQEDQFSAMSRNMRGKIFYQMLALARKCDVKYKSICVDTSFVASLQQMENDLKSQLSEFVERSHGEFSDVESVRLYYDAGQKAVTRILGVLSEKCPCPVEVVQGALQKNHLMLQLADFLCTLKVIECRLEQGIAFNVSEQKFFGSPREFKRNVLRKLKAKELA